MEVVANWVLMHTRTSSGNECVKERDWVWIPEKSALQLFDRQMEVLTDCVAETSEDTEARRCFMKEEASERMELGGEVTTSAQKGGCKVYSVWTTRSLRTEGISSQLVVLVTEDLMFEQMRMSHFICREDMSGTLNAHMWADAVS